MTKSKMKIDIDDDIIVAAVVGAIGGYILKTLCGSMSNAEFHRYLLKRYKAKSVKSKIEDDAGCNDCDHEFNSLDGEIGICPNCGSDNIILFNI